MRRPPAASTDAVPADRGDCDAALRAQAAALLLRCFPEKLLPLLGEADAAARLAASLDPAQAILAWRGPQLAGLLGYFCRGRGFLRLPQTALDAPVAPGQCYVEMLCTAPELRGQGIARSLLLEAEARARRMGCRQLALDVWRQNRPALALYRRAGFRIAGSRRAGAPFADFVFLRLERDLPPCRAAKPAAAPKKRRAKIFKNY